MALRIPGAAPGTGSPLIAGRSAPVSSMSKDSRTYLQRIIDEVSSSPCPGCRLPVRVYKIDQLMGCVTCVCSAVIGFSASLPASRAETPAERNATASRQAAFSKMSKDLVAKMKRGRV